MSISQDIKLVLAGVWNVKVQRRCTYAEAINTMNGDVADVVSLEHSKYDPPPP